jgi:hypothetical protein
LAAVHLIRRHLMLTEMDEGTKREEDLVAGLAVVLDET